MQACGPDIPSDQALVQALASVQPHLNGYPVEALVEVFLSAEEKERINAFRLVDQCLSSWIAHLDRQPLNPVEGGLPEVFEKLEGRQRSTRDALARVHAALSQTQVVLGRRGQPVDKR